MKRQTSAITSIFDIKYPIVSAPMGGVSGHELALAVSRGGGLGLLGGSYGNSEWLRMELPKIASSNLPWGVGLVIFTVEKQIEILELVLEFKPNVVVLSFGDPLPFVPIIHSAGSMVFMQVHTVEQALHAVKSHVDGIIVQGSEAGGHSLHYATLPLLPAVRDAIGNQVPILAAGGIADGRGLAASFCLGADGAMIGTRFAVTKESLWAETLKQAVCNATMEDLVRTRAFDVVRGVDWPRGYSGVALKNEFSSRWRHRVADLEVASDRVRDCYREAEFRNDLSIRAVWAGQVADLINNIPSAEDLPRELFENARGILTSIGMSEQKS